MKKLCIIFLCITLLFSACAFAAFAAEEAETTAPTTETVASTTETTAPTTETVASITETTVPTTEATAGEKTYSIIGRDISEEAVENTLRWIFGIIGYILLALGILGKFKSAQKKMDEIVKAINEMIKSYNKMAKACDKLTEAEASRDLILGALTAQGMATLDILQFAYANSSKLPQPIKDVINTKYSIALKTLDNEEILLALVKQAKGTDTEIPEGKADE